MDGRQMCELSNPLKQERPFLTIIMTARILPEERQWISKMDNTIFMEKPFSPSRLLESVDRYFGVSR